MTVIDFIKISTHIPKKIQQPSNKRYVQLLRNCLLAVGSSVGAFVPFAVGVVEAEHLVVTSFAVVVDAEAALEEEEEEAGSSQAVADLAEGAEVAASPVLAAVKSCNKLNLCCTYLHFTRKISFIYIIVVNTQE